MKHVIVSIAVVFSSLISGCGGSNTSGSTIDTEQQALNQNMLLWDNSKIVSYQFTYNSISFVVPKEDAIVTVVNGKVQSAFYTPSGTYLSAQELSAIPTIDDLFNKIQAAINSSYRLNVSYNASLGYPDSIQIEPGIPDLRVTYLVKGFQ